MSDYEHTPVLLEETVAGLNIRPGGVICDGTLGAAGHAKAIARRLETGTIIGIDRDAEAIEKAGQVLGEINRGDLVIRIFKDNFSNMDAVFDQAGIPAADGILLDLGMSSRHISEPSRGFSYSELGKIDMRMDRESPISGYDIINGFSEEKLIESFFRYGEERFSRAAASAIVARRLERPIETTTELAEIILSALPKKARYNGAGHQSVKRIFQAIRVEVNDEIGNLSKFLNKAPSLLKPGGRCAILSYQSQEDALIKAAFREWADPCTCPKSLPYCVCGKKPVARIVTRHPILPTEEETSRNSRARSAKLRIAERI